MERADFGTPVSAVRRTSAHPALLERLPTADRTRLFRIGKRRKLTAGQMLFGQTERMAELSVILKGRVRVFYLSEGGGALTFAYWSEGTLVGTPAIYSGFDHQWSAVAASPTELLAIEQGRFNEMLATSPNLAMAVIEALEFKAKRLGNICQILATNSVAERLKLLLINLFELYGVFEDHDRAVLDAPFTQEEMAEMVGASRTWISSLLAEMKRRQLIEYRQRTFVLPSLLALKAARL